MKHLVNYQREVDKGRLTAVTTFEKLTFRPARATYHAERRDYFCY